MMMMMTESVSTASNLRAPERQPALLEVVSLVQGERCPDVLIGQRLGQPVVDAVVGATRFSLTGWILPKEGTVAGVELIVRSRLIGRAELGIPRPDLAKAFPDAPAAAHAGFRATLNLSAIDEAEVQVRSVLSSGARFPIGTMRLRRLPRPSSNPVVSLVIPCFNQAHFLAQAIESVLEQTYPEVEIVVVDDGSGDNTFEIATRYPGVRCVQQANLGVAAARNAGFARSVGEFIVFLDADDRLLPNAIEVGVDALARHPEAGFVAGRCRDVGADGHHLASALQPIVNHDHYVALLESCFIWSGSSVMYRRGVIEEIGAFDQDRVAGDDYKLYLDIARRCPIHCHGRVVTEYRRHGMNMTRNPGLVLATQLSVLRSQRRDLRNAHERSAWRTGIRRTRAEHGARLVRQINEHMARREWREALRGLAHLARWNPGRLVLIVRLIMSEGYAPPTRRDSPSTA